MSNQALAYFLHMLKNEIENYYFWVEPLEVSYSSHFPILHSKTKRLKLLIPTQSYKCAPTHCSIIACHLACIGCLKVSIISPLTKKNPWRPLPMIYTRRDNHIDLCNLLNKVRLAPCVGCFSTTSCHCKVQNLNWFQLFCIYENIYVYLKLLKKLVLISTHSKTYSLSFMHLRFTLKINQYFGGCILFFGIIAQPTNLHMCKLTWCYEAHIKRLIRICTVASAFCNYSKCSL